MKDSNPYLALLERARSDSLTILPDLRTVPYNKRGALNDNTVIVGSPGSGKSAYVEWAVAGSPGSLIISDPKGTLEKKYHAYLETAGYRVFVFDFIDPSRSDHYNFISLNASQNDCQKQSRQMIHLAGSDLTTDSFWPKSAELLTNAMLGYFYEGGTLFPPTISGITALLNLFDPQKMEDGKRCDADRVFEMHNADYLERTGEESWACLQYEKFRAISSKTLSCIILTLQSCFVGLDTKELNAMTESNDLDIRSIGQQKTVVFVKISDIDRSKDMIINMFFSQVMDILSRFADECEDGRLPVPVRFLMDDFGTTTQIVGFENSIANIRARGISVLLVLQSIAQLKCGYEDAHQTILDSCDTTIFMGGNNLETLQYFSKIVDKPVKALLRMKQNECWMIRRCEEPVMCEAQPLYKTGLDFSDLAKKGRS